MNEISEEEVAMLKKLGGLIERNGVEVVLPQNLPEDLLDFISEEANVFMLDESGVLCMTFCVITILSYLKKSRKFEVNIDEVDKSMKLYATAISCEKITRYTDFDIERPTLDNILDEKRHVEIMRYMHA